MEFELCIFRQHNFKFNPKLFLYISQNKFNNTTDIIFLLSSEIVFCRQVEKFGLIHFRDVFMSPKRELLQIRFDVMLPSNLTGIIKSKEMGATEILKKKLVFKGMKMFWISRYI